MFFLDAGGSNERFFCRSFSFSGIPTVSGADFTGTPIPMNGGIAVDADGNELKWEEGNHDYFIMFKSLLDLSTECTEWNYDDPPKEVPCSNPQADQCLPESTGSTYSLKAENIPYDAVIEAAYLVWTSAVSVSDFSSPMDNGVNIKFSHQDAGFSVGPMSVEASRQGYLADKAGATGDMKQDFEFEGFKLESDGEALYTYRVDITEFFNEILDEGRGAGLVSDGLSYLGDYNVSGLGCFTGYEDAMVSNWAVIFVYSSSSPGMKPKKIYIYNGLRYYVAEEAQVTVSGFTFPEDPSIRASLMVSEGDAGKQMATYQGSALPPEGLFFKGQGSSWESLSNKCNPEKDEIVDEIMGTSTPYKYTEMFNSISSFYNWDQYTDPVCIGGKLENGALIPDQPNVEWAIDVDTFVINSADYPSQLAKGGENLSFKVSANADGVITNFLVVSLDTKPVAFDIPGAPEKTHCSCSESQDMFCIENDFYFLIRVQNWGQASASSVTVKDTLPYNALYVPQTTEIATKFDSEGRGLDWKPVEDLSGGVFPLSVPYKVADTMKPCDPESGTCEDAVLVRFKVKPKENMPKNEVIKNMAEIADSTGVLYKSNSSVPLRLRIDSMCDNECTAPDLSTKECGGISNLKECETVEDCDDGQDCINGKCVDPEIEEGDEDTQIDDSTVSDGTVNDSDMFFEDEQIGCGCNIIGY